jgi:predicted phosphodiesterase
MEQPILEPKGPVIRTLPVQTTGNLIIVGDIHGCLEEFDNLLKEVNFRQGTDVLVHVGDLVNKGKDSKGVVTRCIEIGAIGVMGNHDAKVLRCYREQLVKPFTNGDLKVPEKRLAKYLGAKCAAYLESLPHILRIPQYNLIVVHAGINPYLPLEQQVPHDLMTMRKVTADGTVIAKGPIDGTIMYAQLSTQISFRLSKISRFLG